MDYSRKPAVATLSFANTLSCWDTFYSESNKPTTIELLIHISEEKDQYFEQFDDHSNYCFTWGQWM